MTRNQRQRVDGLGNGGGKYPPDWGEIAAFVKAAAGNSCVRCRHVHDPVFRFTLTVHHLDMDKTNCQPWNLMSACQRCHLRVQGKVDFLQPYMGEHSPWMQPFVTSHAEWKIRLEPGSYLWKQEVLYIARLAIGDRPPCVCPGWIYQRPDDERSPLCEAHGAKEKG